MKVNATQPKRQAAATSSQSPAHNQIARRAFEIFQKHEYHPGRCQQNWLQAELELRQEAATDPPDWRDPEVRIFRDALDSIDRGGGSRHDGANRVSQGDRGAQA